MFGIHPRNHMARVAESSDRRELTETGSPGEVVPACRKIGLGRGDAAKRDCAHREFP